MGRTRTKSRKAQAASSTPSAPEPTVAGLLDRAQTLIVQCDYELAERFVKRILEREPNHAAAREMLGVVLLETGELFQAQQVRHQPLH